MPGRGPPAALGWLPSGSERRGAGMGWGGTHEPLGPPRPGVVLIGDGAVSGAAAVDAGQPGHGGRHLGLVAGSQLGFLVDAGSVTPVIRHLAQAT
jgi:hypothetical protein